MALAGPMQIKICNMQHTIAKNTFCINTYSTVCGQKEPVGTVYALECIHYKNMHLYFPPYKHALVYIGVLSGRFVGYKSVITPLICYCAVFIYRHSYSGTSRPCESCL